MKTTSTTLTKVTQLLSDCQFHDGTSIGKQLGITRTAVWKIIKKLTSYCIDINSIKGKGYQLHDPLLLLNEKKIRKLIKTKTISITVFEQVSSTNDYLKRYYGDDQVRVCLAESQVSGKGRLNRTWYSPFGQNIYLSMLYPFTKDISELSGLSLIIGLCVCKTIDEVFSLPQPILIKWPNDILIDDNKIAGILIEIQAETHGACSAIIGIGVNVNMTSNNNHQINTPWTSIKKLNNTYNDRNILCGKLIDNLCSYITQFNNHGLHSFLDEWQSRDSLRGKTILLKSGDKEIKGKGMGINNQGNLIIQLPNGEKASFSSGDTTILK